MKIIDFAVIYYTWVTKACNLAVIYCTFASAACNFAAIYYTSATVPCATPSDPAALCIKSASGPFSRSEGRLRNIGGSRADGLADPIGRFLETSENQKTQNA